MPRETTSQQTAKLLAERVRRGTAAKLLGTPESSLRNRPDEITPGSDSCYSLIDLFKFASRDKDGGDSLETQKRRLELRRLANQVENQEADLLLKSKQLVPREYVESQLAMIAGELKSAGDRVARKKKLTGKEAQQIYNAAIKKLIDVLEAQL